MTIALSDNEGSMKYRVVLKKSKEGYSVSCPGLPACWSQGKTEGEALETYKMRFVVPKLPGVNHLRAVRALEKAGFKIVNQGKHIVMSDGGRILTIPRHNPVTTMSG